MLILTRKPGESLYIGDNIKITVVDLKGHQARIGIDAPVELRIYREEIYLQILEENRRAAEASGVDEGLESLSAAWTAAHAGPASAEGDEAQKKKPFASPGLTSFSTSKRKETQGKGEFQVIVKRKPGKSQDE